MAHFAEIDENNIVLRVNVVNNEVITDGDGVEQEQLGADFLTGLLGGTWKQTSYNTIGGVHKLGGTPLRKNYAGIGHTYDAHRDAFYVLQPYPSWTLIEDTCQWQAPVAFPFGEAGSSFFEWDEETTNWT